MSEGLKGFILRKIFIISQQPVLFRDLLEANSLFNEGMLIDGAKLNFRFNTFKTYQIYGIMCLLTLALGLLLTHALLVRIDSHISIIATMAVTSAIFLGFDMFKIWARKEISYELIKRAWAVHFPYFAYEKYSKKVDEIYTRAIKDGISRNELEQHVLEQLVNAK